MLRNKRGSAAVILAIVFTVMMAGVLVAIEISRALVVKSECSIFGEVWAMAILSEYDLHLLNDYGIMGYQGNETEVCDRIDYYRTYSISGKLNASLKGAKADLAGYELRNPDNFKKAIQRNFAVSTADTVITKDKRISRNDTGRVRSEENRVIKNSVVLDTLPSQGIRNTFDISAMKSGLESGKLAKQLTDKGGSSIAEVAFIKKYLNNYISLASEKKTFYRNEWEYIVRGSTDDSENFSSCRRRIFLIRNALDLAYLYKDPEKRELVVAIAEMITPGPGGIVTQALIMESWAAIEAEADVKVLLDGERVPLIKTAETWRTDIGSVINSEAVIGKLDDESRKKLNGKRIEIEGMNGYEGARENASEGQSYEDYIIFLILGTNENVRLLRIMDIVQINMKYRYYEDFNFEEYYCGVRFDLKANGREYNIEKEYR